MPSLISEPIHADEFSEESSRHFRVFDAQAVVIYKNVPLEVLIEYFNTFMQTREGQRTIIEMPSNCDTDVLFDYMDDNDDRVHYHMLTYDLKGIKAFIGNATGYIIPIRTERGNLPTLHMIVCGGMLAAVLFPSSPFINPSEHERVSDIQRGLTHTFPINLAFMQVYRYTERERGPRKYSELNRELTTINSNRNAGNTCWVAVVLKIFCKSIGAQMRLFLDFLDRNVEQYAQVIEAMTPEERADLGSIMPLLATIRTFYFFVESISGVRYVCLKYIQDTFITSPAISLSPHLRQSGTQLDAAEIVVNLFSIFRKLYTYLDRPPLNGIVGRPVIDVATLNEVEFLVSYRCGNHSADGRNMCGHIARGESLIQCNGLKILLSPETETDGIEGILHTTHAFDGNPTCTQCGAPCNIFDVIPKAMPRGAFFCIKLNQPLAEQQEGGERGPAVHYTPRLQGGRRNGRFLFGPNECEIQSISCYRQDETLGQSGHYTCVTQLPRDRYAYCDDFCMPLVVERESLNYLSDRANLLVLRVCGHSQQPDPVFEERIRRRQLRIAEEYDRQVVDLNLQSIADMTDNIDPIMAQFEVNRDEQNGVDAMEIITQALARCETALHNIEWYERHTPGDLITEGFADHSRGRIDAFRLILNGYINEIYP
jgi:hypothetical protein